MIYITITLFAILLAYELGHAKGYQRALERIADGKISLQLDIKKENVLEKSIFINKET